MSSVRKIGLTAAAVIACARAASATMITQTFSFGPKTVAWTMTHIFNGFNPALGTLTAVTETITESHGGSVTATNHSTSSSNTGSFSFTNIATVTLPVTGNLASLFVPVLQVKSFNLPPSGTSTMPLSGSGSRTGTATSAFTNLTPFEGPLKATINDVPHSFGSGASITYSRTPVMGTVTDKLVFTYTPAVAVPEPGSLASFFAGALASLAFLWRRKRARGSGAG